MTMHNLQSSALILLILLTTSTAYHFWFQLFHRGLNVLHLFILVFLISYFAISALRFTAVSFCLSSQTENLNRRIYKFDCFIFTFSYNFKTFKKYKTYKISTPFGHHTIWVEYFDKLSMKKVQKSKICNHYKFKASGQ